MNHRETEIPTGKPITVKISQNTDSAQSVTIPSSDLKKVVYNIVVFLNEDSDVPDFTKSLEQHKNVAVKRRPEEVLHGDLKCGSLDIYKTSLKKVMKDSICLSDEFIKTLMKQITRGLEHVHQRGGVFGEMKPEHIYVSCQTNNAVLTDIWMNSCDNEEHTAEDDIACLGKLFHFILSGRECCADDPNYDAVIKCKERHIASDLIQRTAKSSIRKESFTITNVLEHPFFWSDEKKIMFVCDAFDSIKHVEGRYEEMERVAKTEVFQGDWFKSLSLQQQEVTEIKNRGKNQSDKPKQINRDIILNLARGKKKNQKVNFSTHIFVDDRLQKLNSILEKEWGRKKQKLTQVTDDPDVKEKVTSAVVARYGAEAEFVISGRIVLVKEREESFGRDSFYDLLRFFRNRKAHYCESNENIKRCFQSYPKGFWQYFSSRYPKLLTFLYTHSMKFELIKDKEPVKIKAESC